MTSCIEGVKDHIWSFIESLQSDANQQIEYRLGILAYDHDLFEIMDLTPKIKKFLKSCLYCKSCKISCINNLDLTERLTAIRYELYEYNRKYTWLPYNIPSIFTKLIDGKRIAYTLMNLNN